MIGRRHRFHGHASVKSVYGRGENYRSSALSLKCARRDPNRPYRVAVVVSKKVHKSAVVRNRIRRRIYEIVRQADVSLTPGSDLVFTAYNEELAIMDAHKLAALVHSLLQKAGLN